MLDPESDMAEQLAKAIKHHQKNLGAQDEAERKVEMLRQLVAQLEEMAGAADDEA